MYRHLPSFISIGVPVSTYNESPFSQLCSFCPQCTDISQVLYTFHFVHSVQTSPKFCTYFILSTVYRHLQRFIHISFCPQCYQRNWKLPFQTSPTFYTHFILPTVLPTELEMTIPAISQVLYIFRFVRRAGLLLNIHSFIHFVHSATNETGNDRSGRVAGEHDSECHVRSEERVPTLLARVVPRWRPAGRSQAQLVQQRPLGQPADHSGLAAGPRVQQAEPDLSHAAPRLETGRGHTTADRGVYVLRLPVNGSHMCG